MKSPTLVSHAVVESGREEDSDSLDVRVDADDARTITGGGEAPAFRIVARGGSIMALLDDLRGVRVRNIWPLPGAARVASASASASVVLAPRATAAPKSNPYRPPGFSKVSDAPRPATTSPRPVAFGPELVRAVGRDDGGAVIALRRPSMFYLGVTDASLAPAGPLVALSRKGATVGTPSVAPWGGGGAVAWAEREAGEREWSIVVAGFTPDGEGATTLGPVRVIGKGMSPTLAALPDGDLLLAHADGPPGAHRVVAVRLGRDLDPRGEPLVVSPESINAGQPALAVRPDGRAHRRVLRGRSGSVGCGVRHAARVRSGLLTAPAGGRGLGLQGEAGARAPPPSFDLERSRRQRASPEGGDPMCARGVRQKGARERSLIGCST